MQSAGGEVTRALDHTAIAVRDMDEAIERYRRLFGAAVSLRVEVPDQEVEVAFLPFGGSQLELICPLSATSAVARFIENNGEALHHIAFAVDDLSAELHRLDGLSVRLIDRKPRRGAHGLIAFVHPHGTGGVLVELVQNDLV